MSIENLGRGNSYEKKELAEAEKDALVSSSHNFEQLYAAIDKIGKAKGSQETFTAEQLKDKIARVRSGTIDLNYITRTHGLRDAVERLIGNQVEHEAPSHGNVEFEARVESSTPEASPEIPKDSTEEVMHESASAESHEPSIQETENAQGELTDADNESLRTPEIINQEINAATAELRAQPSLLWGAQEDFPDAERFRKEKFRRLQQEQQSKYGGEPIPDTELTPEETQRYEEIDSRNKKIHEKLWDLEREQRAYYMEHPLELESRLHELTVAITVENLKANPEDRKRFEEDGFLRHYMQEPQQGSAYRSEFRELSHIRNLFEENFYESTGNSPERYEEFKKLFTKGYADIEENVRKQLMGSRGNESSSGAVKEDISAPVPELIKDQIMQRDFSYQDAELPEELKQQILEQTRSAEGAKKYSEALANASARGGIESVRNTAREMRDTMLVEANRLGIPVSPYGRSMTWAMWDIAKQSYFLAHPNENDPKYAIGNPLESESKREEIIDRHIGWEAYAAFKQFPEYRDRITNDPKKAQALEFFKKSPKATSGSLSSSELAELGKLLRA
jgi:hypothetical protein